MELYQASLHAPLLSGVQRPRALANHLGLMFGDRRQDMNCQPIALPGSRRRRIRHRFPSARNERDVCAPTDKASQRSTLPCGRGTPSALPQAPGGGIGRRPRFKVSSPTNERENEPTNSTNKTPAFKAAGCARLFAEKVSGALVRPSDRRSCCASSLNQARSTPAPSDSYCAV
jgi:hypothetical protein